MFWKLNENTLLTFLLRMLPFKSISSSQTSVMVQRDDSPVENLEKLARESQELVSKKVKQDWQSNNCWFNRKRKLWFKSNNNPVLPGTLKRLLLTTLHALNDWSADKTIAFMNKYWWRDINKATKSAHLKCQTQPREAY